MIINVNVEVPDENDKCQYCRFHYRTMRGISRCNLWQAPLGEAFNEQRFVYKCARCLNATRAER